MSDRKRQPRHNFALVILLGFVLAAGAAHAQSVSAIDPFTVRNVAVDVTAGTATAARETALKDGQARALRRLLARLVSSGAQDRMPTIDEATASFLVRDFEVANEKTSSVRYLATLTYRFKSEEVRGYLRQAGLPYAETVSKPVLIVPVLRNGDAAVLWEDPNPWRDGWAELAERDGLVPMIVPFGDLSDMADVSVNQAMGGDTARLGAIADRYGAADSMIAVADYGIVPGSNLPGLEITIIRVGATEQAPLVLTIAAKAIGEEQKMYTDAVVAAANAIEEGWREANLLKFEDRRRLAVSIPLRNLSDWVAVRNRLGRVAVVAGWNLIALTRSTAEVELSLIGDASQLDQALAQADLKLDAAPPPAGIARNSPQPLRVLRRADAAYPN